MTTDDRHDDALPDLLASVQSEIARDDRGWRQVRSWSTPTRHAFAMLAILALSVAVLIATPRLDLGAYPRLRLFAGAAALVALSSFGLRRFLWPQARRAPPLWSSIAAGAGLLLIPVVFAALPAPHHQHHLHPESFQGMGADFIPRAVACLVFGVVVAIPALLVMLVLNRRALISGPRVALSAGVAGLAGTLGLLLHCPLVAIGHRLAGHALVGLATTAVLVGALALLDRRRKSRERA